MATEEQDNIGNKLKDLLNERSLSMRKFSELTEIDTATISRIINGKRKANLHHLRKFAECLGVPIAELFASAGYDIDRIQEKQPSDIFTSIESIQHFLKTSDAFGEKFTVEKVEQQLAHYEQYSQTKEGEETILKNFDKKIQQTGSIGPYIDHLKEMYVKFRLKKGTPLEFKLIGSALLYFIIAIDVLPDYLFPIGFLDDAIAVQLILNVLTKK